MQKPKPQPEVADMAPTNSILTPYDFEHLVTHWRLLDVDAQGADWQEVGARAAHQSVPWAAACPQGL